jgi:hypothetical protein
LAIDGHEVQAIRWYLQRNLLERSAIATGKERRLSPIF